MEDSTASLAAEISALKIAYAAFNRNDFAGFASIFDPDIEWIEPIEFPKGGTHRGTAAVQTHLKAARARWAEGSCEPLQMICAGDRIIQFVHVHVRLKDEIDWREGDVAEVYTFRNGKLIEVRIFPERQQALEWAGVKA